MDQTGIFNLALNAIGARSNIASPTENSREAQVCSLWYPVVRGAVFSAAPWPELTKLASLEVLNTWDGQTDWTNVNARPGYTFAYALPADCARPQYLSNFERFLLTAYADSQALSCNTENAVLAYTAKNIQPDGWSPSLQMAMSYALASHICMPLSGKVTRAKQMVDQANATIMAARDIAANTSNEQHEAIPDWIMARGYAAAPLVQRYIYPFGDLLTVANV